jgi:hypothetical protein
MKIDLEQAISEAEELLAGLRELDGTEIDVDAHGRGPRHERGDLSFRVQRLAHRTDVIRVSLYDNYFKWREQEKDTGR